MGNYSCRCRLRDLVAGTLLGNAVAALALSAFHNLFLASRASLLDRDALARPPMESGCRSHSRPSTRNGRAISRPPTSYLHVYALHFVRHGISFDTLVVVRSVPSIFHRGHRDSSPYRREDCSLHISANSFSNSSAAFRHTFHFSGSAFSLQLVGQYIGNRLPGFGNISGIVLAEKCG